MPLLSVRRNSRIRVRGHGDVALTRPDSMQLVDELAMIYATCFVCFATFSYGRSKTFSYLLGAALAGLAWFITVRIGLS